MDSHTASQAAQQAEQLLKAAGVRLTAAQRQGLDLTGAPTLLLAVPGSGKTTVLVGRAAALLLAGVPADEILNLSFSRESARDMSDRFSVLFPRLDCPQFSTIHSFCYGVLTEYARRNGRKVPTLLGAEGAPTAMALLRRSVRMLGLGFVEEEDLNEALAAIGLCKNRMFTKEEIAQVPCAMEQLPLLYESFEGLKLEMGLMDYDDILLHALTLLKKLPQLLEDVRRRCAYVNLDEGQDVSKVQIELLRLLKPDGQGLFMVGDEDQSIYGFRGAWPQGILSFAELFPGGRVLKMEDNFRSRPEILAHCGSFIQLNRERYPKQLVPNRQAAGHAVQQVFSRSWEDFYTKLLDRIDALPADETLGILYRNNLSALPLADRLVEAGIPFSAVPTQTPLLRYYIRTAADLLWLADNPEDFERFSTLRPSSDLDPLVRQDVLAKAGRGSIPRLLQEAGERLRAPRSQRLGEVLERIRGLPPEQAMEIIQKELRLGRFLAAKAVSVEDPTGAFRCNVFNQFCKRADSSAQLFERIEVIQQLLATSRKGMPGGVFLSTIHSAKGLEFDHVWLVDCCEGILPSRAALDLQPVEPSAYYEEVRLFYVAATRARETFTFSGPPSSERGLLPSRLLNAFARSAPKGAGSAKDAGENLFLPGQRVSHPAFGPGVVVAVQGNQIQIAFGEDQQILKTLSLSYCISHHLLDP